MALVLSVTALSGCPPTDPPCRARDLACQEDEVLICLDRCAPLPPGDGVGARCVVDPCDDDPGGIGSPGVFACPSLLSCVADRLPDGSFDDRFGTCQDNGLGWLSPCDPSGTEFSSSPCAPGLFCAGFLDGLGGGCIERPGHPLYAGHAGLCSLPVREGGRCETSYGEPGCQTCEPGTLCLDDPDDPTPGVSRCQRLCTTDADCPCEGPTIRCRSLDGAVSTCQACFDIGDPCEAGGPPCCDGDPLTGCLPSVGPDGRPNLECCRQLGSACTDSIDCCGNGMCLGGQCRPCGGRGEAPDALAGCCPGLEDRGGVCRAACPEPIGGFGSQCFGCPNGPGGRWVCDDELGTVCDYPAGLSDDDCDGVDDDCSGSIDDAFRGGPCTVPAGTIADCEFDDLPGVEVCAGGALTCDVADYCAIDLSGGLQHGDDRCGTWASQCDVDPSICIGATACNTTCECPVGTPGRCACCGPVRGCERRCWGIDEPPRC